MAGEKKRPAFSFLVCPDSALLLEKISEMLAGFPPASGQWEKSQYWGDEGLSPDFWDSLEQKGLFPSSRAIIVRRAQDLQAQAWKSLSSVLSRPLADRWPILCLECAFERGSPKIAAYIQKTPCYQFAEKNGWIWQKAPLNGPMLAKYVREKAQKSGLKFTGNAFDAFCDSVLPEAACINNELEKLALIARNGSIDEEMIAQGAASPESDAFACIKHILAGNIPAVWKEMKRSDSSSFLFFLIALLSREFRLYWQILSGSNPRMHPKEAAYKQAQARKLGYEKVASAFGSLADAEWQVKSGHLNPEQSLEKLLANLMSLFAPQGGSLQGSGMH